MSTVETAYDSFNSRAHGGRDPPPRERGRKTTVSIHAPTGGATDLLQSSDALLSVSIHAPTGGATATWDSDNRRWAVSIHAPTGGATPTGKKTPPPREFQFTRPRGARQTPTAKCSASTFQFTRPRGARHGKALSADITLGFNSRAHGGRDGAKSAIDLSRQVSIHAPTGGATMRRAR